jgi:capsular exopolysaccharide synthesis family protein
MSRLLDALQQSKRETGVDSLPQTEHFLDRDADEVQLELTPQPERGREPSQEESYKAALDPPEVISVSELPPESRLEALTTPSSFAAEQFRALAARLHHLAERRSLKTILVTSDSFQEGKTLICLNLAVTLARRSARKVLLIEADLRKPAMMNTIGADPMPGLTDWVRGNEPLVNFLHQLGGINLWTLSAGTQSEHPLEVVQSPRMRDLVNEVREQFDWVVVDTAPLLVTDANILSRLVDGTLIVARQKHTRRKRLQQSMRGIENPLGFVLNDASAADPSGYHHYYSPAKINVSGNGRRQLSVELEPQTEAPPRAQAS